MSFLKSYFDGISLTLMFQWFSLLSRKSYHSVLVNLEKKMFCISKMNKMFLSADEILFHIHIDEFRIHMKIHMHSHNSSLTNHMEVQGSAVILEKHLPQIT